MSLRKRRSARHNSCARRPRSLARRRAGLKNATPLAIRRRPGNPPNPESRRAFEEFMQKDSPGTEAKAAAKAPLRGQAPAPHSLFLVDHTVHAGLGRRGMRGPQARRESPTDATCEHAAGNGSIGEAIERRVADAIQSAN